MTADLDMKSLFENLTVEPSAEPLPSLSRSRAELPNPFGDPLLASIEHESPYSIYVPVEAVTRATFLINAAAAKHNVGVRIVVNNERNEDGSLVKDEKGKAVPIIESKGANKGKVLVRFQGKKERKKASAPRIFSIINDPDNKEQKALRLRESGEIVARGTHDEMRAELKRRKESGTVNA